MITGAGPVTTAVSGNAFALALDAVR